MHVLTTENARAARDGQHSRQRRAERPRQMSAKSAFDTRTAVENAPLPVAVAPFCGPRAMEFIDESLTPRTGAGVAYELVREQGYDAMPAGFAIPAFTPHLMRRTLTG
jgi:hypothetical protein